MDLMPRDKADELMDAIHLVQRHLRSEWMEPGCKDERVMGCASCTMTRLHEDLDMLIYEIESTIMDPTSTLTSST